MNKKILLFNKTLGKNEIKNFITWFLTNFGSFRSKLLVDKLKRIGFKYVTLAGLSLGLEDLKIPPSKKYSFFSVEKEIFKFNTNCENAKVRPLFYTEKLVKIWNRTNDVLKTQILVNFRQTSLLNPLYMMTLSGARGNISQIKQLVGMRGLMSDSQGRIIILPIKNNFKEGLNVMEYFIACYGARKGIVDTALKTANSGYLTRRLIYAGQNEFIKQPDCFSNISTLFLLKQKSKQDYLKSTLKLVGRVTSKDIFNIKGSLLVSKGQDICNYLSRKILSSQTKKVFLRLVFSCKLNSGICQLCYGWNLANGRIVELGETVGILAGQSIGEPGTQLTMRTFHTGGIFSGESSQSVLSPQDGFLSYSCDNLGKKIITKFYEKSFLTSFEKYLNISNSFKSSFLKIPLNTLILRKPGTFIKKNQVIAEIFKVNVNKTKKKLNKIILDIKTDITGEINKKKDFLSIQSGNVVNKKNILLFLKKCRIGLNVLFNKTFKFTFNKVLFKNFKSIKSKSVFFIFNFLVFSKVHNLFLIKKFTTNKTIFLNYLHLVNKTGFLVNKGLIKRTLFFSLYPSQIIEKRINFFTVRKTKFYYNTCSTNKNKNLLIKKNEILFSTVKKTVKTVDIVQGLPKIDQLLENRKTIKLKKLENTPQLKLNKIFVALDKVYVNRIAVRKSLEKIQIFLMNKTLNVYKSQGVYISDKHMELIIRRMTSYVIVRSTGSSPFIVGEIIELTKVEKFNVKLQKKIIYEPLILGISKVSLHNSSFISESSFQETTKSFVKSALKGRVDWLYGLKENIVLSSIIPVGTAYHLV